MIAATVLSVLSPGFPVGGGVDKVVAAVGNEGELGETYVSELFWAMSRDWACVNIVSSQECCSLTCRIGLDSRPVIKASQHNSMW